MKGLIEGWRSVLFKLLLNKKCELLVLSCASGCTSQANRLVAWLHWELSVRITISKLNKNLTKIQNWAYKWKISFNLNRTKQAQEVTFSRKTKMFCHHPSLCFNNLPTERSVAHKHTEKLTLDEKLSFTKCSNDEINKAFTGTSLLRKLQTVLPL